LVAGSPARMWTLCSVPASWLSKARVNAVWAGAARQVLSKAIAFAVSSRLVPLGEHPPPGAGGEPDEGPEGGIDGTVGIEGPAAAVWVVGRNTAHTETATRAMASTEATPTTADGRRGSDHSTTRTATTAGIPATTAMITTFDEMIASTAPQHSEESAGTETPPSAGFSRRTRGSGSAAGRTGRAGGRRGRATKRREDHGRAEEGDRRAVARRRRDPP